MWSHISPTSAFQGTPGQRHTHPHPGPGHWHPSWSQPWPSREENQNISWPCPLEPTRCARLPVSPGPQCKVPMVSGCRPPPGAPDRQPMEAQVGAAGWARREPSSWEQVACARGRHWVRTRATGPRPRGGLVETLCYLGGSRAPGSLRVCHCAHTTTQSNPSPRPPRRGLVGGSGWHSRGLAGTARLGKGRTMARGSPRPLPQALHCAGELGPA